MEKKIVLSVIVPVYNVADYLASCIESIIRQSYDNMELLLIDDGSTDASGQICDVYAAQDKRVRVIHKKNEGLVRARKTGVEQAVGEMIAFVDGDDWIEPDMYESMISYMREDVDLITSGLVYDWPQGKIETRRFDGLDAGEYDGKMIEKILPCLLYDNRTGKQTIITSVCNKLFCTKLLKKVIQDINDALTLGEDGALICSYMTKVQKLVVTSLAKYHYVQHEQSMIRKYDFHTFQKIYCLEQCLLNNFSKAELNKGLQPQIRSYVSEYLEWTVKAIYQIDDIAMHYIFPYECIEKGKRIVLYGAGIVGKSYYKCIIGGNYAQIVMWVDRDWENKQDYPIKIENPKLLSSEAYDYIVIAIENEKIAAGIKNEMIEKKIPMEKIIWKKPLFIR